MGLREKLTLAAVKGYLTGLMIGLQALARGFRRNIEKLRGNSPDR